MSTNWKTWWPRVGRAARVVGVAVLAVPAVVWLRRVLGKDQAGEDQVSKKTQGRQPDDVKVLTDEERDRDKKIEEYASQIVSAVVSRALEQYKRELQAERGQ